MKNQKVVEEMRTVEEQFYVQEENGSVRPLTKDDKPEQKVYHILPRKKGSTAIPETVRSANGYEHPFIAKVCPRKQKDGQWVAKLDIHPVILYRIMLGRQKKNVAVSEIKEEFGTAAAKLWGGK